MKIAIYTLTHQRDKFIDGMLAEYLRQYGHDVVIRDYIYGARESICYEKPDAIIHPMVGGEYKIDTVQKCREWGVQVIVRRGEAGMGREQFIALDDNRKKIILGNWDYSPYVDLELTWGQEFADIIAEQGWMPADKLRACGAFAFDPYFNKPQPRATTPGKRTVLFATGFSTADSMPGYCETGLPEGSDYHEELHQIHSAARDTWLEAIKELTKWFSDEFDFELKVRPGESVKVYVDKVPSCVKVHPEGAPSSEVLRSVDILVHSGSTLAIEAHLSGIPSFNFCNVNPDPLLSGISPMLKNYRELEWNLRRVNTQQSNIDEAVYGELQEHLYGTIDGRACERAAGYIHEHLEGKIIKNTSPMTWPKEAKYFTDDGIHLTQHKGDVRWSCPCCRNIFWGEAEGIQNCPYCNMKIERTSIEPGSTIPSRKTMVVPETESVLK
jgi:surface carbohydrate biosynthesis protein